MDFETNSIDEENTQMGFGDSNFGLADIMASAGETQSGSGSSISSASPPSHDWHTGGPSSWMDGSSASGMEGSMDAFLVDGLNASGTGFDIPQFDLSSLNDVANMHMGNITLDMYNNFGFLPPQDMHKSPIGVFPTQQQQQQTVVPNTIVPNSLVNTPAVADDIAAVVKQITGITNAQVAGAPSLFHEQHALLSSFSDNSYSSASSDRSSVPPQTIEPHQSTLPSTPSSAPPLSPSDSHATSPIVVQQTTHIISQPTSRPKTAHTTIERRYRTNLNTCITGLREAIPAVRYLDKNYVPESGIRDTVDENGCVDGVKAARKISKATIMSKAREYIVVLKRREDRTRDELNSLKALVSSLVGGPKLLEEWQRLYAVRQAAAAAEDDMIADDEDDLDGEDEEEDEDERPRKKSKASASAPTTTTNGKGKKEKSIVVKGITVTPTTPVDERPKKRGRPPKNTTAPASSRPQTSVGQFAPMSHTVNPSPVPIVAQPTPGQQYSFVSGIPIPQQQQKPALFFASFVFLSFFKPATRRTVILASEEASSNRSHVGQVLSDGFGKIIKEEGSWWSHEAIHVLHTAIMLALFAGLVLSLAPQRWRNKAWRWISHWLAPEGVAVAPMVEEVQLEDISVPLKERAERELKNSSGTSKSKLKVFNAFQSSSTDKTAEELGLMAFLRFSTKASQALELWKEASLNESVGQSISPAFEIPLPQAVELISTTTSDKRSPLVVIASKAVEHRLERSLKDAFIDEVFSICDAESTHPSELLSQRSREELVTVSLAVGGKPAEVVKHFDSALSGTYTITSNNNDPLFNLLKVISLISRIFPTSRSSTSGLPSPPPSPLLQEDLVKMERALRVALGSVNGVEIEKAKDLLISRLSARARSRRAEDLERD